MLLRAAVDQLDEAHAALGEPAGDEALPAEAVALAALQAVERERRVAFLVEIEDLARLGLHVEGGLEGADARGEIGVAGAGAEVAVVERVGEAELEFLQAGLLRCGGRDWRSVPCRG